MVKELKVVVPDQIYKRIIAICKELNISTQDILLRSLVKTIEDFEKVGRGGRR